MVYLQAYWLLIVGVVLTLIESGFALRCWKCSSDMDATCRDYFNTTRIFMNRRNFDAYASVQPARTPELAECEGMHTSTYGVYKNVCLKRIYTVPNGPPHVQRECRVVGKDLKYGTCPEDFLYGSNSKNMEYCGTCELDGCNSASKNSLIFLGLAPAVILLLRFK